MVIRSIRVRTKTRKLRFIGETCAIETERERGDGCRGELRHQSDDHIRIDTTRKKRSDRNITHESILDRLFQQRADLLGSIHRTDLDGGVIG